MKKSAILVLFFSLLSLTSWGADSVGTFFTITPGDDTSGMARIQPAGDGGHVLTLSNSFLTQEAPAVYVVLHKETIPMSYTNENAVILGMIQSFSGMQQYYIPAQINPDDYEAVIIWCKEFNVTFGAAKMMSILEGFR